MYLEDKHMLNKNKSNTLSEKSGSVGGWGGVLN